MFESVVLPPFPPAPKRSVGRKTLVPLNTLVQLIGDAESIVRIVRSVAYETAELAPHFAPSRPLGKQSARAVPCGYPNGKSNPTNTLLPHFLRSASASPRRVRAQWRVAGLCSAACREGRGRQVRSRSANQIESGAAIDDVMVGHDPAVLANQESAAAAGGLGRLLLRR